LVEIARLWVVGINHSNCGWLDLLSLPIIRDKRRRGTRRKLVPTDLLFWLENCEGVIREERKSCTRLTRLYPGESHGS
jgi:hypothetical protein